MDEGYVVLLRTVPRPKDQKANTGAHDAHKTLSTAQYAIKPFYITGRTLL